MSKTKLSFALNETNIKIPRYSETLQSNCAYVPISVKMSVLHNVPMNEKLVIQNVSVLIALFYVLGNSECRSTTSVQAAQAA